MKDFERLFSDFIDGTQYDKAEEALFSLRRMAFMAGWLAAGGEIPNPLKMTKIFDSTRYKTDRE